jgi:2'-5' RNA ligase
VIRAFVAIELPDAPAEVLESAQVGIPAGRLVPSENFHITLAFLGEHPEPVLEDVHAELDRIAGPRFEVALDGLGTFGGDKPRVLFAHVTPNHELSALRKKVRQAVRAGGVELSHERYHPHVTLARMAGNGLVGEDAVNLHGFIARRAAWVRTGFDVDHFGLYESKLGRAGPVYSMLAEYPLWG